MRERIKQKKTGPYTKKRLKAIELLIDRKGKDKGECLRLAGYSDNYAHNPQNFTKTLKTRAILDYFGTEIEEIKKRMAKTRNKARYKELGDLMLGMVKMSQLMSGEATERIAITPEERKDVDDAFLNL